MTVGQRTLKPENYKAMAALIPSMIISMGFFGWSLSTVINGLFDNEYMSTGWVVCLIAIPLNYWLLKAGLVGMIMTVINFINGNKERNLIDLISNKLAPTQMT